QFPLQCNTRGKTYGWYWMPGAQLDLPGIELGEALTLALLDDTLKTMLPLSLRRGLEPRFQQARRKLEALAEENATARWFEKVASVQPQMSLQTRSEEHTSELQSRENLVCRLLLEKKRQ